MNDGLHRQAPSSTEKHGGNPLRPTASHKKRHSSCKRRSHKRRPYDSSPHLELRLQLLNSSDDEDGRQEQKQDPASPEEVLGDPDAGNLSLSASRSKQELRAAATAPAAATAAAAPRASNQTGDGQQPASTAKEQQQQQQDIPAVLLHEVIPESPGLAVTPLAVRPSPEDDEVVPGTPDEELLQEGVGCSPGQQQLQFGFGVANQKGWQPQPHQQLDFAFPDSAAKQAGVTPTIGIRAVSRLEQAGPNRPGFEQQLQAAAAVVEHVTDRIVQLPVLAESSNAAEPKQQRVCQVQQAQHAKQLQVAAHADSAVQTPRPGVGPGTADGRQAAGAAGAAAGPVPGKDFVGCTPSTANTKNGRLSPSDDALCALMHSYDRKQPTRSCAEGGAAAAAAVPAAAATASVAAGTAATGTAVGVAALPKVAARPGLVDLLLGPKSTSTSRPAAAASESTAAPIRPAAAERAAADPAGTDRTVSVVDVLHAGSAAAAGAVGPSSSSRGGAAGVPPSSPVLGVICQLNRPCSGVDANWKVQHWLQHQQQQASPSLAHRPRRQPQQPHLPVSTPRKQQPQQPSRQAGSRRYNKLDLQHVLKQPACQEQQQQQNMAAAAAAAAAETGGQSGSPLVKDSGMDLLSRQQQQQQRQQPEVSPANLSDRSGASGKSAVSLTPNTLAALELLEMQYAQQQVAAAATVVDAGCTHTIVPAVAAATAAEDGVTMATGTLNAIADHRGADMQGSGGRKPPRPPVAGLASATLAAAAAAQRAAQQAGLQQDCQQQQQQTASSCGAAPTKQQLQAQQQCQQQQDLEPQQQNQQEANIGQGLADNPTAKRRSYMEQQTRLQQQQQPVVAGTSVLPADSPLPAKVLFNSAMVPGSSEQKMLQPQHQQEQQRSWQQPQQQRQGPSSATAALPQHWQQQRQYGQQPMQHPALQIHAIRAGSCSAVAAQVQPVVLFENGSNPPPPPQPQPQPGQLQAGEVKPPLPLPQHLRQHEHVAPQIAKDSIVPDSCSKDELYRHTDAPAMVQHEATIAEGAMGTVGGTAAAAAAAGPADAHVDAAAAEEESSSDSDEDDLGGGYGVFSQAAAVARMMRVSQRLDESYRATQLQQLQQRREHLEQQIASQKAAMEVDSYAEQEQQEEEHTLGEAVAAGAAGGSPTGDGSLPHSTAGAGAGTPAQPEQIGAGGAYVHDPDSEMERELQSLTSYLPQPLVDVYRSMGLTRDLYPWQAECLHAPGVLDGTNLVYCAPTSGGKSLVAEVLMLRRLLSTGRPALLVMPYVSLCAQKAAHLQKLLQPLGRKVKSLFGGLGGVAVTPTTGVVVCTIEKANALVNKMLEDDTLSQISCVVVDELHMVGDDDRGYLLELMLTKLRYATQAAKEEEERRRMQYQEQARVQREQEAERRRQQQEGSQQQGACSPMSIGQQPSANSTPDMNGAGNQLQIIGMSATLPNVDQVAQWLDAVLYQTDFRPVQLHEYVKLGGQVFNKQGQMVRELSMPPNWPTKQDNDLVALLTNETVQAGHSVLIFCCSKNQCEVVAKQMAKLVVIRERTSPKSAQPTTPGEAAGMSAREGIVAELARYQGRNADYPLKDCVSKGVAFHHAGLTADERELVERAYWSGAISVLCATSTLAAGVNLPARRVIFKHAYVGIPDNMLDTTKYRQMSGRAGRAGLDTEGESFLVANQGNYDKLLALMRADSVPITSCLVESRRGMKRAMLEVVASGVVTSSQDVERYLKCSLLAAAENYLEVAVPSTLEALKWLGKQGFLQWEGDSSDGSWSATDLGVATSAAGLDPAMALLVKKDLEQARMGLCLASDLHLTYLVTPFHQSDLPDLQSKHWQFLLGVVQRSQTGPTARVIQYIGLDIRYVQSRSQGMGYRTGQKPTTEQIEAERVAKRLFAALVLTELICGDAESRDVAKRFDLNQGQVEGLQEKAGAFAHTIVNFCERHKWQDMEALFSKFQGRLCHGVKAELVALTEIPYVKGARAKLLYKAGLRTPEAVAASDINRILEILLAATPRGGKNQDQQLKVEKKAARSILQGAKDLVAAKARELAEQQEALLAAAALAPGGLVAASAGTPISLPLPKSPPSASRYRAALQQRRATQEKRQQQASAQKSQRQQQQQNSQQPLQQQSNQPQQQQQLYQQQVGQPPQQQHQWTQQQQQRQQQNQQPNPRLAQEHVQQHQLQHAQHELQTQFGRTQPQQWQQQPQLQPKQAAHHAWQQPQQQQRQQIVGQPWQGQQQLVGQPWQQQQQQHPPQQHYYQRLSNQPQHCQQQPPNQHQQQQQQQQQFAPAQHQQQQLPCKRSNPEAEQQPAAKRNAGSDGGGFAAGGASGGSGGSGPVHYGSGGPAAAAGWSGGMHDRSSGSGGPRDSSGSGGGGAWLHGSSDGGIVKHDMPPPSRRPPAGQQCPPLQQQRDVPGSGTPAAGSGGGRPYEQYQGAAASAAGSGSGQQKGITIVKDAVGMRQLIDTLSACKCWGFSVAYDSDTKAPNVPLAAPGMGLPEPPGRRSGSGAGRQGSGGGPGGSGCGEGSRSGGSRAAAAAVARVGGDDVQAAEPNEVDNGGGQQEKVWSWSVLGVAFSTADSCAYYVPLTRQIKSSSSAAAAAAAAAGGDTVREGTGKRLHELWEGLRHLFTYNRPGDRPDKSVTALAAAGADIAAAVAAMRAEAKARPKQVVHLVAPASAAAANWLRPGPVRATYALKQQLAMLASPPAASGLKGFHMADPLVDVRIAAWTLDPDSIVSQEDKWGPEPARKPLTKGPEELLAKFGSKGDVVDAVGDLRVGSGRHLHACKRACMALKLHKVLAPILQCECVLPVLMGMEMPMVRLLAAMEARGIAVKLQVLVDQKPAMKKRLKQLEARAAELNKGVTFSLASSKECAHVLYDRLKLPIPPGATKSKSGNPSTKADVLDELMDQHELPGIIKEHRTLSKLLDSFVNLLESKVMEFARHDTPAEAAAAGSGSLLLKAGGGPGTALLAGGADSGFSSASHVAEGLVRIRGTYLQTNTSTGRLAMEDPSFQTIPRPVEFEVSVTQATQPAAAAAAAAAAAGAADDAHAGTPEQQVLKQSSNIRASFVAPPGSVLMSADYCQIELRLMAHFSRDEALLAALARPGQDPFVAMAATWRNLSRSQVSAEDRNHAKRLAYGLLYGMGPSALGKELRVSMTEAMRLADDFRRSHPGLDAWIKDTIGACQKSSWITTISGRRRHLPHINADGEDRNAQRAQGERQSVNSVCQGSAADLAKGAMLMVVAQLEQHGLTEYARPMVQVHDELLFEVSTSHLPQAAALVRSVMEQAAQVWGITVPLPVKLSVGPSWGQLEPYG